MQKGVRPNSDVRTGIKIPGHVDHVFHAVWQVVMASVSVFLSKRYNPMVLRPDLMYSVAGEFRVHPVYRSSQQILCLELSEDKVEHVEGLATKKGHIGPL